MNLVIYVITSNKLNRCNQEQFHRLCCGFKANADLNAAINIAERFGDDEIKWLRVCEVETVLAIRFLRRRPVDRSATAGLELHVVLMIPSGWSAER